MHQSASSTPSPAPSDAIRTVIVDDDDQISFLLSTALEREGAFDVVGEQRDARRGCRAVAALEPELVVLDLNLGGRDGLWMLRRLRALMPPSTALALVTGAEVTPRLAELAAEAGADLVGSKQGLTTTLPESLRGLVDARRRLLAAAS